MPVYAKFRSLIVPTFDYQNETIMKTYKNKNFKKGSECTNVVFCQAETAPSENWIEVDSEENKLTQLYIKAGVRYFGYL